MSDTKQNTFNAIYFALQTYRFNDSFRDYLALGALIAAAASSIPMFENRAATTSASACYQLEYANERECASTASLSSILSADAGVCYARRSRNSIEKHVHTRAATQTIETNRRIYA